MTLSLLKKFSSFWKQPMVRLLVYTLGVLVIFLGMLKACSSSNETNVYRVARDVSWYPLDLLGKEQNMVGFTNDLFEAISDLESVRIELIDASSNSLFFGLDHDNWEGILSSLQPDVNTQQRYQFSEPFYISGLVMVVQADSPIKNISEMKGKIVGMPKDAALSSTLAQSNAIFTPYPRIAKAAEDMIANRIDAIVVDYIIARLLAKGIYAGKIRIITLPQIEEALRLVAKKTPQGNQLVAIFNSGLGKMAKDGTLEKLLIKWSIIYSK